MGCCPIRALPALVISSLLALWAWWLFVKNRMVPTLWASFVSAAFLAIGVFGFAQLDLRSLKLSDRLAEVARNVPCENPQVATLGYREPSLVFLTGTNLDMLETGAEAAAFLRQGGCRVVFVERRFEGEFRAENERLRPAARALDPGSGIQYQQRAAGRYRAPMRRASEGRLDLSKGWPAMALTDD